MFDLADKRLVWIPVRWPGVIPGKKDGEPAQSTTHEIECQCELVDRDRLSEIFTPTPEQTKMSEAERFLCLVHDWRGVKMGKTSAPMTAENVALMLKVPMFADGFNKSYMAAWTGQLELREKNFNDSSADGAAGGEDENQTATGQRAG